MLVLYAHRLNLCIIEAFVQPPFRNKQLQSNFIYEYSKHDNLHIGKLCLYDAANNENQLTDYIMNIYAILRFTSSMYIYTISFCHNSNKLSAEKYSISIMLWSYSKPSLLEKVALTYLWQKHASQFDNRASESLGLYCVAKLSWFSCDPCCPLSRTSVISMRSCRVSNKRKISVDVQGCFGHFVHQCFRKKNVLKLNIELIINASLNLDTQATALFASSNILITPVYCRRLLRSVVNEGVHATCECCCNCFVYLNVLLQILGDLSP